MAKGVEDCAFYRWSRLTSLNEVGGDPRVFSVTADEFHDAMADPAARVAARDDRAVDPRHQARRGRPRPDHRAGRGPRRLGATRSTGCSTWRPLPDPGFGDLLWQAIVGAWPAPGRRRLRERLHGVRREGDARGRRPHHVDRARRGLRGGRARAPSTRPSTTRGRARCSTSCSTAIAGAGLEQRAGRQAGRAHHARRARRLPGQRAVGAEPGRPRQPAAGRLRPRADAARRARATAQRPR